jgi:cytochrome P450
MSSKVENLGTAAAEFNYWDPRWGQNPYPMLEHLRKSGGVGWSTALGGYWTVSSYSGVLRVLTDPDTFSSRMLVLPPLDPPQRLIPETLDQPEHQPYRRVFSSLFTPRKIRELEDEVRTLTRELIGKATAKPAFEFVSEFAVPLPCTVFLKILGLPMSELDRLLDVKEAQARGAASDDPVLRDRALNVVLPAAAAYFNEVLDERAADPNPPDDVLTAMVTQPAVGGVPMPREDMISALFQLVSAGLDTVTAVLGLSFELLASRPDLQRQLADDPGLIPSAVEELLRYWGIVTISRQANVDTQIDGVPIKAGEYVAILTPSANRDEIEFGNPTEIDFRRTGNRHVAFGAGPHRCLGSHLARMELQIALEEWHAAVPEYRLASDTPAERHFGAIMGLEELQLAVGAR